MNGVMSGTMNEMNEEMGGAMKRAVLVFALFFALFSAAFSRSNPFEPVLLIDDRNSSPALLPQQFESEEFRFPSGSKILREIKIIHQEDDGSIGTIERKVNRLIDWHAPLKVDQSDAAKLPRRTGVFLPVENLENIERIKFFTASDVMKIRTKDSLIRSFFVPRPSRITLDFNSTILLEPQSAAIDGGFFTRAEISFHETFYRVVITLDSYYPYTIEAASDGYLLGLN
ncbi:AMIN domain-containing protein [Campylobacterota bacterium]|nr:AMIN domain-containing protein [Campylobacterota bacterium]